MNLDFACHGDDKFHSRFAALPGKPKINLRFALDSLIFSAQSSSEDNGRAGTGGGGWHYISIDIFEKVYS